ncbi:MAG: ribonuclease Z [Myxococcota bacterium]
MTPVSARELIVLGTASQVPTRYRNHNGYFLRWDDEGLLFDPGEGTQRQMIRHGVTASQVTRLFVTHFHGDHCLGLASLCQRVSLDRVPQAIDVFFPASGEVYWHRLRGASIYHDVARLQPRPVTADGVVAETERLVLEARKLDHDVDCFGYRLSERAGRTMQPDALEAAGVRGRDIASLIERGALQVGGRVVRLEDVSVPRPGQSMAFVMDTRRCEAAVELARGVDLLVIESTYLSSRAREAYEHGHLTAHEAALIAKEAGARRLVLTHFSQRHPRVEPFLEEAGRVHDDVVAARDGDRIPVPARHSM